MPISFKPAITAIFYHLTPEADRIPCPVCGGPNLMGKVSKKVDCAVCSQTGYENYFTPLSIPAFYSPRAFTRWNSVEGGLTQQGECQIKVNVRYDTIVNDAKYVHIKGVDWKFSRVHIPGQAFGQERIILALTRK